MPNNEKMTALRLLLLITTPKLADKATEMFHRGNMPVQFRFSAAGTASSEIADILGLGSTDKSVLVSMVPQYFADAMIKKLHKELRLGTVNSGIAFSMPISGGNNIMLKMLEGLSSEYEIPKTGKEVKSTMSEMKYALIAAFINQGFSEEVMNAARPAGASGGTVFHSRRITNESAVEFWGLNVQPEKEIVLILAEEENKRDIMQAISEHCGMHSDAKGMVVSLPVETVIGIDSEL